MKRHLLLFLLALVAWPSAAHAQQYFPFGSVAVGISSTNVRVGPFGCYVNTSDPTYTNGEIHPCSLTTTGKVRVSALLEAGDLNVGNIDVVSMPADATELPAAVTAANDMSYPTAPFVNAVLFCDDGATLDKCSASDGGAGSPTANTTRMVESTSQLKRYISGGTNEDESEVKGTAGVLRSVSARNSHATNNAYLKCVNQVATSTTPGTTAIVYEMLIPAGPGGMVDTDINYAFSTALTCYIVLGNTDAAVDEVAADQVSYNLRYE